MSAKVGDHGVANSEKAFQLFNSTRDTRLTEKTLVNANTQLGHEISIRRRVCKVSFRAGGQGAPGKELSPVST